ncbi:hypothetical protein [Desulfosarcina variabilis]|uniref:hypothetical protein n=1 Tax=Desulfosarcina variabilis TaxID=2300 RepID=UPI003AFB7FFE
MGTPSYIVLGLGNPESFMSCSHGAPWGRAGHGPQGRLAQPVARGVRSGYGRHCF